MNDQLTSFKVHSLTYHLLTVLTLVILSLWLSYFTLAVLSIILIAIYLVIPKPSVDLLKYSQKIILWYKNKPCLANIIKISNFTPYICIVKLQYRQHKLSVPLILGLTPNYLQIRRFLLWHPDLVQS